MKATKLGLMHVIKKAADDYGPEILSLLGNAMTCLTAFTSIKSAKKVAKAMDENKEAAKKAEETAKAEGRELTKTEKINLKVSAAINCADAAKVPLACAGISVVCNVTAMKLTGSKIAKLTAAVIMGEDKIKRGIEKFKERYGEEELIKFRDDLRNDIIGEEIENGDAPFEVSKDESGAVEFVPHDTVFFDTYLHSLIDIPESRVQEAIDLAEDYVGRNHCLNFNKWRGFLGLEDCPAGAVVEFNPLNVFDVKIGEMSFGSGKIKTIEYVNMPTARRL
jgi:hypothetical protein